jgi:hypothetical protein
MGDGGSWVGAGLVTTIFGLFCTQFLFHVNGPWNWLIPLGAGVSLMAYGMRRQ